MLKPTKKCCSFYISKELQEELKSAAKRERRSVSSYICELIVKASGKI